MNLHPTTSEREAPMSTEPDPQDLPEPDASELVFPFIACLSEGGRYDDDAFVAGYQCGRIDNALAAMAAVGADRATYTVRTDLVKQLELIGMHHRFNVTAEACDDADHWSFVTLTRFGSEPTPTAERS
jgi:hypothetical protein